MLNNKLNKKFTKNLKHISNHRNVIRYSIIFLILFYKQVPDYYIQFIQSTPGKIIFALLIALLVYTEPMLGVLATVYYLFLMNEYNNRFKTKIDNFKNLSEQFESIKNTFEINSKLQNKYSKMKNLLMRKMKIKTRPQKESFFNKNNDQNYQTDMLYYKNLSDYTMTENLTQEPTCRHNFNL